MMFNNRETALSAIVVAAVLIASFFAISFVQQALAQANMTSAGGAMNKTGNMTSAGGAMMNQTGNTTSMNATD